MPEVARAHRRLEQAQEFAALLAQLGFLHEVGAVGTDCGLSLEPLCEQLFLCSGNDLLQYLAGCHRVCPLHWTGSSLWGKAYQMGRARAVAPAPRNRVRTDSNNSAAPAVCAVASHRGKPRKTMVIPILSCNARATRTA